jgi:methyl-accepting chemotaxis protein
MNDHQVTPSNDELLRDIALVVTAVANGELSHKITVEAAGEMLELKKTINTMVDQLQVFASEAMRIAREAGSEGDFGGRWRCKA